MKNLIIAAFLAIQIGLPLSYYLGDTPYDERFAWRMFSPVRIISCDVQLYDATQGPRQTLNAFQEMHVVWRNLMRRGRIAVVEAFAAEWCARPREGTPDLRVELSCGATDQEWVGICRKGPVDRDGDGVPDGYADAPGCEGDPKDCFKADCGDASMAACHRARCRVTLLDGSRNLCEGRR